MLDILACPVDKTFPLELYELEAKEDGTVIDGVLFCNTCSRFYPIIDEIEIMHPDELRNKDDDLKFLERWKEKLPEKIIHQARPWHLET